jgi:dihydrofolate reductase
MLGKDENVFIIGGGNVYQQFLSNVDKLYITHIHHTWDDADTFFPEIDPTIWQCISQEHHETDDKHLYPYTFANYIKR